MEHSRQSEDRKLKSSCSVTFCIGKYGIGFRQDALVLELPVTPGFGADDDVFQ